MYLFYFKHNVTPVVHSMRFEKFLFERYFFAHIIFQAYVFICRIYLKTVVYFAFLFNSLSRRGHFETRYFMAILRPDSATKLGVCRQ